MKVFILTIDQQGSEPITEVFSSREKALDSDLFLSGDKEMGVEIDEPDYYYEEGLVDREPTYITIKGYEVK